MTKGKKNETLLENIEKILTEKTLSQRRPLGDLSEYLEMVIRATERCKERRDDLRLKTELYKEFRDEFWPLAKYVLKEYSRQHVEFQYFLRNQSFDAKVFNMEGKPIESIELAFPMEGHKENKEAKEIQEKGFSISSNNDAYCLIDVAIKTLDKKSQKDYRTPECKSSLVVAIGSWPYFKDENYVADPAWIKLVNHIEKLDFKVDLVVVMFWRVESGEVHLHKVKQQESSWPVYVRYV